MKRTVRFKCGHEGCNEFAHYEADNKADTIRLQNTYGNGKWLCTRHSRPDELLSLANNKIVTVMRVFEEPHGKYWGTDKAWNGFIHGPGFKGFAKDFPVGTTIEVTAKIRLPE